MFFTITGQTIGDKLVRVVVKDNLVIKAAFH